MVFVKNKYLCFLTTKTQPKGWFFVGRDTIGYHMATIIGLTFFIFGTIIGSFLNVVSLRHNTGKTLSGRSFCFSCGKTLVWYELIPVLSFIFQKGRCRECGSKISWQYPIVEVITGILFFALSQKFLYFFLVSLSTGISNLYDIGLLLSFATYSVLFSILIAISVYDIKHKIIPDKLVYLFIFIAFLRTVVVALSAILIFGDSVTSVLFDLLAGPIVALPLFLLWFFSNGKAMGFGDVKLTLGLGWMMPLWGSVAALMMSFWVGGVVGVILLFLFSKKITMKTEVPFAPFLIFGTILAFFFEINFGDILGFFD